MKLNLVGVIVATHGIKGEVKVKSDTSFPRFQVGNKLYIKKNNNLIEIEINSHRVHKDYDLITFNNLKNINDVIEYVGSEIYVDVENLNELAENEYYYDDLIGLDVYSLNNEKLGVVKDLLEVPQGLILLIEKLDKKEALVPFVEEYVIKIDKNEKKILINPIEGLL